MNDSVDVDPLADLQEAHRQEFEFEIEEGARRKMPMMLERKLADIEGAIRDELTEISFLHVSVTDLQDQVRGLENQLVIMHQQSRPSGLGTALLAAICAMLAYALFFRT